MRAKLLRSLLPVTLSLSFLSLPDASASADSGMSRKEEIRRALYHIYMIQQKYDLAEKEVAALSLLNPHDATIHGEWGRKLFDLQKFKQAYPHLVKATQLDPSPAAYWANRGACEMQLGRYKDAVDSFRKAVQYQKQGENYMPQLQVAQQYYQHQLDEIRYNKQQQQKKKDEDE